jgi:hypothetical protein
MEFNNEDNTKYGYKNIALDYNIQSTINEVQAQNSYGYFKREFQEDADAGIGAFVTTEAIETDTMEPVRRQALINRYGTHAMNVETNFNLAEDENFHTNGQITFLTNGRNQLHWLRKLNGMVRKTLH